MANFSYSLRQLRYFVGTVEHGGVAQASRQLSISQPSISAAIKNMEESFGVQLFIRHHASGVSLTPVGMRFYQHAFDLLRHAREFEQNALAENDTIAGQIEFGAYVTVAPLYLPRLIAGFREHFPRVRVNLADGVLTQLKEGLATGKFDLAMMYDLDLDDSTERVPLLPGLMPHAVLPAGHRLADRSALSLHQLAAEPLVLLDLPPSSVYFQSLFKALGLNPDIAYRSPSLELVRGLVGQGLGYSVLVTKPPTGVTYDGSEIVTVPLSDPVPSSPLVIAWHGRSRLTKPAQAFLKYCQEAIAPRAAADTLSMSHPWPEIL